jgi:hypothetical protein
MMVEVLQPIEAHSKSSFVIQEDKTAPNGLTFVYTSDSKPLSTPWQVSDFRGILMKDLNLPDGPILDCACGSGIQLAAIGLQLRRPMYGIELDKNRARASASNIRTSFDFFDQTSSEALAMSKIFVGDSTSATDICHIGQIKERSIGLLYLDPARPRNSRTHSIEEMQPPLDAVLRAWGPYLAHLDDLPAICFDVSPRLSEEQRHEIEGILKAQYPAIPYFWQWSSRGGGRTDRLMLWAGCLAHSEVKRRFVRYPPNPLEEPLVLTTNKILDLENTSFNEPEIGHFLTTLDTGFVESGLANAWLKALFGHEYTWLEYSGRRPTLTHTKAIHLKNPNENLLVQASGEIVAIYTSEISLSTMDEFCAFAISNGFSHLTLRFPMEPNEQPVMQRQLDRSLEINNDSKSGFVMKHPDKCIYFLCFVR